MSSPGEVPLGIRVTSTGVDESLQNLRRLHDELLRGDIVGKEYRKESKEQNTILNANTKLWNESKAAIYAANPTLLEFSRTMAGFGQITAAATSGMTAINTAMLLLAGGSDSINQVKIKIAELTNQLDNLENAGMGNTTQAQNLRNTISQLKTELGNLNNQFTGQQIEAAISFGSALGQMAVGGASAYTTLKTLGTFMGEKSFFSSNIAGILGTSAALLGVVLAALAAGTAVGEAFNQNKQAVSDFRAQLDASFGDNPFTNYIILPIAAMIDELNGNKADWNADVKAMGDAWSNFTYDAATDWVNFENVIINGLNTINHARNSIFGGLDKLRGVTSPSDIPNIALPMQSNTNADSINKMLIGNPITTTEQKQQLQLTTEQNQILEQTKTFGQALTSTIQSSTNPILSQSNTTLTGIYQSSQASNQLAQQQLQSNQQQKEQISNLKQSIIDNIKQITDLQKLPQTQLSAQHYDADTGAPIYTTIASDSANKIKQLQQQNAQSASIIASSSSAVGGLDNMTSGLDAVLSSIGLNSDTGIGSIISGALGDYAGIGGAGINDTQLKEFVRTHDYGVFTRAALSDNTVTTPTDQQQIASLASSLAKNLGIDLATHPYLVQQAHDTLLKGHVIKAASGFSGMVSGPTNFLAGESGPEFVHISPSGKSSGNTNITVNVYPQGSVIAYHELDGIIQESLKQSLKRAGFT